MVIGVSMELGLLALLCVRLGFLVTWKQWPPYTIRSVHLLPNMSSTGEKFPSEVIAQIVEALTMDDLAMTRAQKADLAACSMTCRYWAAKIQPLLFASLELRNAEDIQYLLGIISRKPHLGKIIDYIELAVYISTTPYIHHLPKLSEVLSPTATQAVSVHNMHSIYEEKSPASDIDVVALPRSANSLLGLPRAIPISALPITTLTLGNFKFTTRLGLLRLVTSLPKLTHCWLTNISFVEAPRVVQGPLHPGSVLCPIEDVYTERLGPGPDHSTTEILDLLSSFFLAAGTLPLVGQTWTHAAFAISALVTRKSFAGLMGWSRLPQTVWGGRCIMNKPILRLVNTYVHRLTQVQLCHKFLHTVTSSSASPRTLVSA